VPISRSKTLSASIAPRSESKPVWTWLAPLVAALAVFAGVLLVTPPGLASIGEVLLGPTRGARAEAAAYALGAAASLALLTLACVWAVCALLDALVRRLRR
jgi:hypothetical protein